MLKLNLKADAKKAYIERRVLVEPNYKENFIHHYRGLLKKPQLNLMYLIITESCNFECPYCFIENNFTSSKRSFMSWDTAKRAIDYFLNNSKGKERKIIFYGGEPTLNQEVLMKSIEYIRQKDKKVEIGINTNGSIYNKKLSNLFKKNDVIISISLDSFPELNKFTRIQKTQKGKKDPSLLIENNINAYLKDGVYVTLSITLNSYNIDFLPAFAKYIYQKFPEIKSIGFNLPLENLKKNRLFVDPAYAAFQIYNSYRILRHYGIYEDRVLRRLKHIVGENIYLKDCGACGNQIVVSSQAFVGPCHAFLGMKKYFEPFTKDYDFYTSEIIKEWNTISPITKKECLNRNCPFILICGNSCPYFSYITTGNLRAPDSRMCRFLPIFINEIGKELVFNERIKYVLVDYDGTLISRKPTYDILQEIKNMIRSTYHIKKQNYYDIREIITLMVKNSPLNKKSQEKVNELIYLYLKKWKEKSELNKPLLNQLKLLKEKYSFKIMIVSNSYPDAIEKEIKHDISLFDKIIGKGSLKYNKKDRNFPEYLFKKLNIKPEETVYIGDSFFSDILPFYKAGVRICISFYAEPSLYHRLNNNWLVDIIEDAMEISQK